MTLFCSSNSEQNKIQNVYHNLEQLKAKKYAVCVCARLCCQHSKQEAMNE